MNSESSPIPGKSPRTEWFKFYKTEETRKKEKPVQKSRPPYRLKFRALKQFRVFITRDFSKITMHSTWYYFVEAPVLAFLLAFIIKYYNVSETN